MARYIINGRFLTKNITGVQRYAWELCRELDKIIKPGEFELVAPPEVNNLPNFVNISVKKIGILKGRMWEHVSFPWYVKKQNAISINFCNVAPLLSPGIVFIYDMKIKAHPEFFNWKFKLWYELLFFNSMKRAKMIFTDSEFAKAEIMKYYPYVNETTIKVIYAGWQHMNKISYDENALKTYNLVGKEFYFALSSMDPNKNFKWIAEQALKNPNIIYAIAGAINDKVFANGLGFNCPNNMKLLGYVTDGEAKTLMRECRAFLFPSIYEGFGIPPLEALACGAKKVIVNDIPVMNEIFGKSVSYIGNTINKTDNNVEKLLEFYSWEKSAKLLLDLLNKY